jgi:hypothetical protein
MEWSNCPEERKVVIGVLLGSFVFKKKFIFMLRTVACVAVR